MQKNLLMAICVFPAFTSVKAQDSTKAPSFQISGSADVYYRHDFSNPESLPYNNFTSFTHSQNSFALGMASVKAEYTKGKAGLVADIGFGKRAEEFSYNDAGTSVALKQLYVTYTPVPKIKVTLGSWATHIGYELVDAYGNRNYSMSYLFSYGPFFHTGLKSELTLGEKSSLMVGVANPADLKQASNLPKMLISQLALGSKDEKLKVYVNFQGGKYNDSGRLHQEDVVMNYTVSPKLSLGYNGTLQTRQEYRFVKWNDAESWWGTALYVNLDPKSWLAFTLRGEYFNDKRNILGLNADIFETTLSANFKVDDLVIIPEFRFENAGEKIYQKSNGTFIRSTGSFLLAAVYKF